MKIRQTQTGPVRQAGVSDPIVMSNVRCGPLDTDITRCKLTEGRDMFLNSCTHADDVGLRCYDVSWSGIRLGMTAKRSKLYDVKGEQNWNSFLPCKSLSAFPG